MKIEKYMNDACYNWSKKEEFYRNGLRHMKVVEYDLTGRPSKPYVLHEKNNKVYNKHGDCVSYGE